MKYEIVNLEEKKVMGVTARTKNSDPDMPKIIGGLWEKFYQGGVYGKIGNKANEKAVEIYSDYATDVNGEYSCTVGCEVSKVENINEEIIEKTIPSGKYAKFIVKGDMVKAVQEFWMELWNMDLDRSYKCDFEEYQDDCMENATIFIYISIN